MESWIELKNVCINIPIYGADKSFRSAIVNRYVGGNLKRSNNIISVQALDAINLKLNSGDRLGLIGHNGAGKSTLLSVLAGVYKPEIGSVACKGKITPLFNLAPGMDPVDTGLENIMTVGMYLGMSKQEIKDKTESIVEFTELSDYINLPVRTYSAGMIARLTFGIATSLEPDILLIDEGIGAGDHSFAHKAKQRLEAFYNKINIIVVASHSSELIKQLCNKAILMEHGKIIASGTVDEILNIYSPEVNTLNEVSTA
jgi:ABC-type polysaccharide/polyol phosphate transport system ATPase subunit